MRLIGFFIAIVLAVVAAFAVFIFMNKNDKPVEVVQEPKAQEQEIPTVTIWVAKSPINIGTVITPDMVDSQRLPQTLVNPQFVVTENPQVTSPVVGMITRAPFQEREPLLLSKLANPNDPSFLAATLEKGMRAVTISIDSITGVAGFVFPGDRVDILLTRRKVDDDAPLTQRFGDANATITEILLSNTKVLAVDQRSAGAAAPEGGGIPAPASSISVEVTKEDAQRLRLAEKVGALSLVLRPLKSDDEETPASPTVINSLAVSDQQDSATPKQTGKGVRIIRGTAVEIVGITPPPSEPTAPAGSPYYQNKNPLPSN